MVCDPQALFYDNLEQSVTLTDAMVNVRELLGSGRSNTMSDLPVRISKLTRGVQRSLTGVVESEDLGLQKISGLIEKASSLRKEFFQAKSDEYPITAENSVVVVRDM